MRAAIIMAKYNKVFRAPQLAFARDIAPKRAYFTVYQHRRAGKKHYLPLYSDSHDISRAFDGPPKINIKLGWARLGVPDDIIEWLVNII